MKNCLNCKYGDLLITEEPCNVCKYSENWEPEPRKIMKKTLVVVYEPDMESDCNCLYVVDPETKLPNGNSEVIKILIGSYADEIYKELTEAPE